MRASEELKLMAGQYGMVLEAWHFRLAELTTAMTVIGLFRDVAFEFGLFSEVLIIKDEITRGQAKRFMREVAIARRTAVTLFEPVESRPQDSPLAKQFITSVISFPKHPEGWVDRRTSPEARERLSKMMKERHAKARLEKPVEEKLTQKEFKRQVEARLEKLRQNPPKRKEKGPDKRLKNRVEEKETLSE